VPDPFAALADTERRQLRAVMRRRRFRRHEVVCHQGDPGDSLHVVIKGRFLATIVSPVSGQEAAVNFFGPGSYFGELALIDGSARSATICAIEPAETLELRRRDFEELVADEPSVQRFLLLALAQRVRDMTEQIAESLFTPVEKRVHRRLLALHDSTVAAGGDDIVLRQEDLATMAGTTRPTLNRVLRRDERAGIVDLARGRIRVRDRGRLARLAR
jgi:CRP-like cAMP-binding protein